MQTQSPDSEKLSSYASSLNMEAKTRYLKKMEVINGMDPFSRCLNREKPTDAIPPVEATNIVAYLVLQTSFFDYKTI